MKLLRHSFLTVAVVLCHCLVSGQIIPIQTVNSGGRSASSSTVQVDYTIGDFAITELEIASAKLTQGFLQPAQSSSALPVRFLQFNAMRINNNIVKIEWKTVQEITNKGFFVERKKEGDLDFSQVAFVKSAAPGGSSNLLLSYQHNDTNSLSVKSYYRLKQVDIDGRYMFSAIQLVNGSTSRSINLKAWPNPATGPVNISAEGIDKDLLLVLDNTGRLIRQLNISSHAPVQISGLTPGVYIIRLASDIKQYQRIIVQ